MKLLTAETERSSGRLPLGDAQRFFGQTDEGAFPDGHPARGVEVLLSGRLA